MKVIECGPNGNIVVAEPHHVAAMLLAMCITREWSFICWDRGFLLIFLGFFLFVLVLREDTEPLFVNCVLMEDSH